MRAFLILTCICSFAYGFELKDDFNDNSLNTDFWTLEQEQSWVNLSETNQRLEFTSTTPKPRAEVQFISQFEISSSSNFKAKVDFYLNHAESGDSGLEFVAWMNASNYLYVFAGLEDGVAYYYWSAVFEDAVIEGSTNFMLRSGTSGTMYISYETASDTLYIGSSGYGASNAMESFSGIVRGLWNSSSLGLSIGGETLYCSILPGQAYFDNLQVDEGVLNLTGGDPEVPAWIEFPQTSTTGKFSVTWQEVPGALCYQVEESNDNKSSWHLVSDECHARNEVPISISSDCQCWYRVRAHMNANWSDWLVSSHSCMVNVPPKDAGRWEKQTVDNIGCDIVSLAFDSHGKPGIVYCNLYSNTIKCAIWNGSSWNYHTISTPEYVTLKGFLPVSIAFNASDMPAILYIAEDEYIPNTEIHFLSFANSSWADTVVCTGQYLSQCSPLIFSGNGQPAFAYRNDNRVFYAEFNGTSWGFSNITNATDSSTMDLKLTPSGYPALVYCESAGNGILNLKYASRAGGQWNIQMVDSAAGPQGWIYGYDLSLAFDRNGNPGIYDNCNLYKYGAGSWSKTNAPITHWTPQLIFDIDNNPRLAGMYWSGNSDNLKYYTFYNTNWNWGEELEQMPDPAYNGISMKVDKDGIPSLAYSNNNQIILAKWYRVGDLDHNGRTNLIDLAILADQWCALTCRLENDWCKEADLDRNGFVLMKDLVVLCDTWLWQTTD